MPELEEGRPKPPPTSDLSWGANWIDTIIVVGGVFVAWVLVILLLVVVIGTIV